MAARRTAVLGLVIATIVVVVLAAGGGSVSPAEEGCCGWTWDLWSDDSEVPLQELVADDGGLKASAAPLEGDDLVTLFVRIASVLAVAVVAYLIGRFLWRTARAVKIEPLADPAEWDLAAPTARDELSEAVDTGLAALASGPVDEMIVACWVRLEEAVAKAGVERSPWETPSELATRALRDLDVPETATQRLLSVYREARYSRHELNEESRTEAADALREIRAALGPVGAT